MFLRVGEFALVRLHRGYSIPSTANMTTKLRQQYVGPFKIPEKIGRLACRFDMPGHWQMHPVFTIAQQEPYSDSQDNPFNRPRLTHPPPVYVEGDTDEWQSYRIKRLLNRRITRRGRGWMTEYLVRWVGYGPEPDM